MNDEHRSIILSVLKQCSDKCTMNSESIRDRLKMEGMKAIVIKDGQGFAGQSGN